MTWKVGWRRVSGTHYERREILGAKERCSIRTPGHTLRPPPLPRLIALPKPLACNPGILASDVI
eukprot:scaffold3437_cov31-Tisochrysis_lutea.AAC.5